LRSGSRHTSHCDIATQVRPNFYPSLGVSLTLPASIEGNPQKIFDMADQQPQPVHVPQSEVVDHSGLTHRKGSVAAVELVDSHGRRKTVHLDGMTDADRELAEKYGYKPVSAG
jgi:hypothetical protein